MPNANRPSGPGKPIEERRDAVAEAEGIDEVEGGRDGAAAEGDDSSRRARQAERDASVPEPGGARPGGRGGG